MKDPINPAHQPADKDKFSPKNVADAGIDHGRQERNMKDVPRGAGAEMRNKAGKR